MKLLTFRKNGERTVRVGGMSEAGDVVDLTSSYAAYLYERDEPKPIQLAHAFIPSNMIEFINGRLTSLKAAQTAIAYAEEKSQKAIP